VTIETVKSDVNFGLLPTARNGAPCGAPFLQSDAVIKAGFLFHFFGRHQSFPAQLNLAIGVDSDALDHDLLALADFIGWVLDPVGGHLGNVQQAVQAREDGDEGAELDDLGHPAQVGLAHFGGLDQVGDHLEGDLQFLLVGAGHLAGAVVVDVHGAAAHLDDVADGRAALADDVADLFRS